MPDRPRVLFLAHLLPWPLDGGGQIKSFHTLRILSQVYDVTLLALIRRPDELTDEARAALDPYCVDIQTALLTRGKLRNLADALMALISNRSFIVERDHRSSMVGLLKKNLSLNDEPHIEDYDPWAAIHVDHLQMMRYIREDLGGGTKVVLDNHNVEYRIPKRLSEAQDASLLTRWYAGVEWKKLRNFEEAACRRADLVLTVSEEDRETLAEPDPKTLGGKIVAVPIGVDLDYWGTVERRPDADAILSIGTMYWPPNVDAIRWFCAEILPLIRKELSAARLVVVGAKPTAAIRALGDEDPLVEVTGSVPDVRPYAVKDGGVFIVPLRSGSGMRVKILTAMAMGLPVVSTTVGAEGILVTDGVDILIGDSPQGFADAVIGLLRDPARAADIGQAGRRLMERSYSWDAVGVTLLDACGRVIDERKGELN